MVAIMISCFTGGTIVQSLTSREKYEAIKEVIDKAPVFTEFKDRKKLKDAVVYREKMLSTGLGRGVAIAHGTTSAVKKITIAMGISEKGIDFDSIDKAPVHLLFVITSPPEKKVDYLAALAAVTSVVRDDTFRESLCKSDQSEEIEKRICAAFDACLKKYQKISA